MKLISFVGTSDYKDATYFFQGQEYTSRYFPVVAVHAFQPDELLLVVTEEAYLKHFEAIADEVHLQTVLTPVRIPAGKTEPELWDIFDILTDSIDVGDEVIFDITLSFRSIPILAVIAAAFWRTAKQVTLRNLIYGAFEAKDEQGRSPIFDLTPMLSLMDWTVATDKFLKTGNAAELGGLLKEAQSLPYRNADASARQNLPRHLQDAAGALDSVSKSMRLMRPHDLMSEARKLNRSLSLIRQEVDTWAKPFAGLLDQTQQEYRKFIVDSPREQLNKNLGVQMALIEWYVQKDQIVQAITLAREWLVSLVILRLNLMLIEDRDYVELLLNVGANSLQKEKNPLPPPLRKLEGADHLVREWNWLRDLRNDVAHCGMRKQPRSLNSILSDAQSIVERLRPLLDTAQDAN
jgi:hypothetical protein